MEKYLGIVIAGCVTWLLSPIVGTICAAAGGLLVQATVGGFVVDGAAALGVKLSRDHLWELSVFLAFIGSYFRDVSVSREDG